MADKGEKKQLPLRLSPTLWNEIHRWAEDDFRSINGQIEYILSEAVKKRKKSAAGAAAPAGPLGSLGPHGSLGSHGSLSPRDANGSLGSRDPHSPRDPHGHHGSLAAPGQPP